MSNMPSAFGFFTVIDPFLFESINIQTKAGLFLACLVVCLLAVAYEGLRVLREILLRYRMDADESNDTKEERVHLQGHTNYKTRNFHEWCGYNLLQSALHMLQLALNYTLMLSVMTYNAWMLIAVVIGAGLGFFILSPRLIYSPPSSKKHLCEINVISSYSSMDTGFNGLGTHGSYHLQIPESDSS